MNRQTSSGDPEAEEAKPPGAPAQSATAPDVRLYAIDLVLVLALTAGLFVLTAVLVDTTGMSPLALAAILAVESALPMAAVYLVVIRRRGLAWSDVGFTPITWAWALRAFLIGLVTLPVLLLVNLAGQALSGTPFRNPQLDFLAPAGFSWKGLFGMLAVVGIVAPIVEETIFRGLLYGWLRARIGVMAGIGVSALVFAVAHGIVLLVPALAATGLVLATVYERSGSLWPAIIVHGTINSVMVVALYVALAAAAAG